MIKKIFNWVFKDELDRLNLEISRNREIGNRLDELQKAYKTVLSGIDVSVDVHEYDNKYSQSWAVLSLQGQKTDYIKFMELGQSNIYEISKFLRQFERNSNIKIDASPTTSGFLKIKGK